MEGRVGERTTLGEWRRVHLGCDGRSLVGNGFVPGTMSSRLRRRGSPEQVSPTVDPSLADPLGAR